MQTLKAPQDTFQSRALEAGPCSPDQNQHMVPIDDLLTAEFVCRHSQFRDVDSWLSASGLNPSLLTDLDPLTRRHWDDFARLSTTFPDWATLLRSARGEWIMRRIGIFVDA